LCKGIRGWKVWVKELGAEAVWGKELGAEAVCVKELGAEGLGQGTRG